MENAAKALEIAAGVLIAVMIMTLFAYFFMQLGIWPQQEDKMESAEQLAKFNLEYEIYQKSAMYGVDVISCLNKAKSNNEKYAESGSFFTGISYEDSNYSKYYIDIYVHLNSNLEERLEVYYMSGNNTNVQCFDENRSILSKFTMGYAGFEFPSTYTKFSSTTKLNPKTYELTDSNLFLVANGGDSQTYTVDGTSVTKTYYSLRGNDNKLVELLNLTQSGTNLLVSETNSTGGDFDVWTKAIWYTALYDFKTKKFKCDYLEHSEKTGRVNKIYFSEI